MTRRGGLMIERACNAPIIVCDDCGERILDAKDGNFVWSRETDERGFTSLIFLHKICDAASDAHRRYPSSGELRDLVAYIFRNIENAKPDAARMAFQDRFHL